MVKEISPLEKLKEDYKKLEKKFSLPDFNRLNEEFHIEKISEIETDFLLREVRRYMAEKYLNYLKFVENLIHPTESSIFVFSVIKALGVEEKEELKRIYKSLVDIEINLIRLDLVYSEEKEIEFIKDSYSQWQNEKKELAKIVDVIKKNFGNNKQPIQNGKGYFG